MNHIILVMLVIAVTGGYTGLKAEYKSAVFPWFKKPIAYQVALGGMSPASQRK